MSSDIVTINDYPLRHKRSEILHTPEGVNIDEITFENVTLGKVSGYDCRISKDSLLYQATIAEENGNQHLADNFYRAAEMVDISSDRIIEIYNALRPYRSTESELRMIVYELRNKYNAEKTATFIEEAIAVLKNRDRLKGNR